MKLTPWMAVEQALEATGDAFSSTGGGGERERAGFSQQRGWWRRRSR